MFNKKKQIVAGAAGVVLLLVIASGWFLFAKKDQQGHTVLSFNNFFSGNNAGNNAPPATPPPTDTASTQTQKSDKEVYADPLGFSFIHATDLTVTAFDEGAGEMVLVHDATNAGSKREFQIYAAPFDEAGPLTAARIHKDLPDMEITDAQPVLIGSNKDIDALIFFSNNPSIGKTREVWFVHGGYMYQVTGYADADAIVGPLLDTWSFAE